MLSSLMRFPYRVGCNDLHTLDFLVLTEAPRLFQILTLFLIAIARSWQPNNVASGIPRENFKV